MSHSHRLDIPSAKLGGYAAVTLLANGEFVAIHKTWEFHQRGTNRDRYQMLSLCNTT